jgi:tRNA A-37 threonylcarbamoyl transferase component Bud32
MDEELKGGRYKVEARIGRGGMGVVFRAYDTRLSRLVALKMVPDDVGRDPELLRRLSQEARAAASITHPGVATVYDFEEHGQESFIVYEYVEGMTLREHLSQHRSSIEEAIEIGIQLAEALCAAHDRGIVHRDLKPENLMLVSRPAGGRVRVKILDFGLAKRVKPLALVSVAEFSQAETSQGTSVGVMVGTVNYMSPEQVQGKVVDSRTDLYAMGLVLYEMATGANPFQGENLASTIANIVMRDPPPMPDLNPVCPLEVDRILRKCLRKPKEERYQSAHELLVDIEKVRGAHPSGDNVDTTREQMPRGLARALFILIQAGYLAMYTAAFNFLPRVEEFLALFRVPHLPLMIMFSALCGAALRLYFISAATLDYPNTGRLFRWVFPTVLVLDAIWAASPLTLFYKLGYPVLLMTAGLACLPFSQRTLVSYAYAPRGGRVSSSRSRIAKVNKGG